jgi:hypothetical protein
LTEDEFAKLMRGDQNPTELGAAAQATNRPCDGVVQDCVDFSRTGEEIAAWLMQRN